MDCPTASGSYAFILKLTDQPGGMEVIAATFAHRGVSLSCSLGNDGALDPEGRATMIVTFCATPAKKEIIRRALGRLSRVRSLAEYPLDSPRLRKTALFRVAGEMTADGQTPVRLERLARDEASGESTYLVTDRPDEVDALLEEVRRSGRLLDVTTTVIGL
ncbi:MAG: hypothetical protein INR65_06260 [Gluconacetobacter diazotrophicus]|nr:hypothetical protein [Gluconacetobacter diazotrophicus]